MFSDLKDAQAYFMSGQYEKGLRAMQSVSGMRVEFPALC